MTKLQLERVLPEAVIATYENVFLSAWRGPVTLATIAELQRVLFAVTAAYPEASGGLTLILPGAGIPPAEVRQQIAAMRKEAGAHGVRGGAIVYEEATVRGAVLRGIVGSIGVLARGVYPQEVFDDIPSAAEWLVDCVGVSAPPRVRLVEAVQALRGRASTEE